MMSLNDFRSIFLYEFKVNQSAAETVRKINQAFGNYSVNVRTIRSWFAKFRSKDFGLEDEPRSGRFTAIQGEDLRTLVETDRPITNGAWDGGRTGRQLPCCF